MGVEAGPIVTDNHSSFGCAWVDFNNDGYRDLMVVNGGALDLFVAGNSTRNALYQNVGNGKRWLKVRLTGTRSNPQAVGAKVFATATVDGQVLTQRRQISADSVLQETEAHFGLGTAAAVSRLRIEWPSRIVQEFTNVAPNRILSVIEPRLTGAGVAGGGFQLEVTCDTNRPYALDASTTLATWQNVAVFTNGSTVYVDPTAPDTARFYRLR